MQTSIVNCKRQADQTRNFLFWSGLICCCLGFPCGLCAPCIYDNCCKDERIECTQISNVQSQPLPNTGYLPMNPVPQPMPQAMAQPIETPSVAYGKPIETSSVAYVKPL